MLHHEGAFTFHLYGMLAAFIATAVLVTLVVQRLIQELAAKSEELSRYRESIARNQQLASLSTLAASAAHQLGTPLSTIALVSKELTRKLGEQVSIDSLRADAALIREQAGRCKTILDHMHIRAGEISGEQPQRVSVSKLQSEIIHVVQGQVKQRLRWHDELGEESVSVPFNATVQVVANLIQNAAEASREDQDITIRFFSCGLGKGAESVGIEVRDQGAGMTEDLRAQVSEPFFSTKRQGRGLGLFLADSFAKQMGGELEIISELGEGSTVRISMMQS
ncbi:MAG: HAMP domain-containing histidine kinase [Myxococcales bacterium]|nr:MAG: HAMP domain-containing histidine kinase [Myxococcales bacterium]